MIDSVTEFGDLAVQRYERAKARRRRLYQLAKSLGFSAAEANVLCARSEATIRALAAQREQAARELAK